MGFTPGVVGSSEPWLNPKAGKLFRMAFAGHAGRDGEESFRLEGANVIEGFRRQGYRTIGSGAVDWFNTASETGSVLAAPFERFHFAGNTWSLAPSWPGSRPSWRPPRPGSRCLSFLNVGETHVPYWHEGPPGSVGPAPACPLAGRSAQPSESRRRQRACLEWVDAQLARCWPASPMPRSWPAPTMAIAGGRTASGSTASAIPPRSRCRCCCGYVASRSARPSRSSATPAGSP